MYYEQMRDNLYTFVPLSSHLTAALVEADRCWRRFCELPYNTKRLFAFPKHNHEQNETAPGYTGSRDGRDKKEYYHYIRGNFGFVRYYKRKSVVMSEPIIRDFFEAADEVDALSGHTVQAIGRDLGDHIPIIAAQIAKGREELVTRYLHYTPAPGDVVLAKRHFDRGGGTIHLHESHPWLRVLTWDGQWIYVPAHPGHALMYAGYRLHVASGGDLQPVWHDVVRPASVAWEPGDNRTSIVNFVALPDVPGYPKDKQAKNEVPGYTPRKVLTS